MTGMMPIPSPSVVGRALGDAVARVDAAFGPDSIGYGITSTAIMFGVIVGGLVGLFLVRQALLWVLEKWYMRTCKGDYVRVGTDELTKKPIYVENEVHNRGRAFTHVTFELAFLVLTVAVIWFGYFSAGFNFLNSPYLGLALSLTGTYMFGAALSNLSAKILNNAENQFPAGTYVRIPTLGPEVHGFMTEQTAFHIILTRRDEHGARRRIKVSCADFFNHTVIEDTYTQYLDKEAEAVEVTKDVFQRMDKNLIMLKKRFSDECGPRTASPKYNYKNV